MCMYAHVYIYIYIYIYTSISLSLYIYVYICIQLSQFQLAQIHIEGLNSSNKIHGTMCETIVNASLLSGNIRMQEFKSRRSGKHCKLTIVEIRL